MRSSAVSEILATFAPKISISERQVPLPREGTFAERVSGRLLMAPMAGVTDGAWRLLARCAGATVAYSEMVSVAGLHYRSDKTWELVEPLPEETELAVQLFGREPDQFREAAHMVATRLGTRLALIDVNMACPVPKVTRNGAGSALMDEPGLAQQIVRACRAGLDDAGVTLPVTAKIRRGRTTGTELAPGFAVALEQAGVSAVAIHGRFADQLYRGQADWGAIGRVAEAVGVPVIGTGDVFSHEDALRMLEDTGSASVMVARGSYGNPWVFSGHVPTTQERVMAFACHVRLLEATGAHMARARSLAGFYLKGMAHAAVWRQRAYRCNTAADYLRLADDISSRGLT